MSQYPPVPTATVEAAASDEWRIRAGTTIWRRS
jgi:hypothetical protein